MPNSTVDQAKEALYSEISRLHDPEPTYEELRVGINQIRSWHAYENDGTSSQALMLGVVETIQDKSFGDNLVERCLRVTGTSVRDVAGKYLNERNRTACCYLATTPNSSARKSAA